MGAKPRGPAAAWPGRKPAAGAKARSAVARPAAPPAVALPAARVAQAALVVALPVLALYAATLHPGLPAGDSGELITVAATGGVAHPPGYPLYTMLAGVWLKLVPVGSVAWRLNLFSALCMAAAAGVLAAAVARLSRSLAGGVLAGLVFATATVTWRYALVAEVFALHALLGSCVLFALTLRPARGVVLLGFSGALTLSHHHTLLLLALPAWGLTFVRAVSEAAAAQRARTAVRLLGASVLAVFAGLLPLLWIPIATRHHDALVWGDATTLRGFLSILLRAEYGTFQLDAAGRGVAGPRGMHALEFVTSLPGTMGWLGLLLAGVGAFIVLRRSRSLAAGLGVYAILQWWFFTRIGFESGFGVLRGVVERFHILPALVLAFAAGLGGAALLGAIRRPTARIATAALLFAVLTATTAARAPALSERGNTFIASYARALLAGLPEHAVLFTRGDVDHNALEYLTRVEHRRADITLVDQELLTYPWYVRQLRAREPGLLPPFRRAERITLASGRMLDGVALPRDGGVTDLVVQAELSALPTETTAGVLSDSRGELTRPEAAQRYAAKLAGEGVASLPSSQVIRTISVASESLYSATRTGFRTGPFLEDGDDRYSGFPGSRNLLWADHLAGVRPLLMTAFKENSYALRYERSPMGRAQWLRPRHSPVAAESLLVAALAVVSAADTQAYFRDYARTSFEWSLRRDTAHDVAQAALALCQPFASSLIATRPEQHARVLYLARRLEALPSEPRRTADEDSGPTVDAFTLRAIGFLRVFDPAFRDTAQARRDIERALSQSPSPERDAEAQAILRAIAEGRVPSSGPAR